MLIFQNFTSFSEEVLQKLAKKLLRLLRTPIFLLPRFLLRFSGFHFSVVKIMTVNTIRKQKAE